MLSQLLVVDGENDRLADPDDRHLLRQCPQGGAPIFHDPARLRHLFIELRVVRRQPVSVGRFRQVKDITLFQLEAGQRILRQDDANRVADRGQLERDH